MTEGEERGMPEYAKKEAADVAGHHADAVALAVEKGVKIALGTDIWATGLWGKNATGPPVSTGSPAREMLQAA